MAGSLEPIKGGGGSIKVGTSGTIGSLMTRELESLKNAPTLPRKKPQPTTVSVPCGGSSAKISQSRRNFPHEASSSNGSCSSNVNYNTNTEKDPVITQKTKSNLGKSVHSIPMLSSDGITTPTERTPSRDKRDRKVPNLVEVVDLKCGHPDKAWSSPIANRLKKLGFSKLSETIS
ncbi:uncharacterized protein [Aristolochia californica]|uniref:uncharacterized protein n=1 Tax=Aristolochia californica TaxID=171875 RepID=UPI0035D7D455